MQRNNKSNILNLYSTRREIVKILILCRIDKQKFTQNILSKDNIFCIIYSKVRQRKGENNGRDFWLQIA